MIASGDSFNGVIDEVRIYDLAVAPPSPSTIFDRGDCNTDGAYNIADPVFLLAALFTMGPAPDCDDACDFNDDGGLGIADPIYGLSSLFSMGPLPPDPHACCAADPTDDALGCDSFAGCP